MFYAKSGDRFPGCVYYVIMVHVLASPYCHLYVVVYIHTVDRVGGKLFFFFNLKKNFRLEVYIYRYTTYIEYI